MSFMTLPLADPEPGWMRFLPRARGGCPVGRFVRHKLSILRLVRQSGAIAQPGLDTHPCLLGTEGRDG